jgi:tetratricopeptide (TPR) repeat protein
LDDAERAFKKALDIHEDSATAYLGLSTVYRRQGRDQETVDAALAAVGLLHRLPVAHFNLGVAMARTGSPDRAVFALETALKFRPTMINAHRWLAALYRQELSDADKAEFHRRQAQELRTKQGTDKQLITDRMFQSFSLPAIPTARERAESLDRERPLHKPPETKESENTFLIVSGMPRSGTSLMMQMLQAGGILPKTDGERQADVDNPKGYFEWEAIKEIGKRPDLLDEEGLEDKAIKAISMLLPSLPKAHRYKVIFMMRPVEEIVASQAKMIERLQTEGAELDKAQLTQRLQLHCNQALKWLTANERIELLNVDYPALVSDPQDQVQALIKFLGEEREIDPSVLAGVVDASLHRQKSSEANRG